MHVRTLAERLLHIALGASLLVPAATAVATQQTIYLNPLPQPVQQLASNQTPIVHSRPEATELAARLQAAVDRIQMTTPVPTSSARQPGATTRHSSAVGQLRTMLAKHNAPASASTTGTSAAAAPPKRYDVRLAERGSVRFLSPAAGERFLTPALSTGASTTDRKKQAAMQFFQRERALFGLADPDEELKFRSASADALGHTHLRFDQYYRTLRVFGAQLVTQFDSSGNLLSVNGAYAVFPRKFSAKAVVGARQAEAIARNRVAAPGSANLAGPSELLVYIGRKEPRLVWRVRVDEGPASLWSVFVDAISGNVLAEYNEVQSGNVSVVLPDLLGEQKAVNLWEEEPDADSYPDGVYAVDTTKPMYDGGSNPPDLDSSQGVIVVFNAFDQPATSNPDSIPPVSIVGNGTTDGFLADAVSALHGLSATYDYFNDVHGRNSLDGVGGSLKAIVRFGQDYQNAVYLSDQQMMIFGTGDLYAAALDVVAHEMTHGVISTTAGLVYLNQSGALNEAFADIFGEMVEGRINGTADWIIGTRLNQPIRNMADPGAFSCGGIPCPTRMSEYVFTSADNGGVHTNSGIVNRAFYLLAEGLDGGIGTSIAEAIFYRALTTKLVPLSEFIDLRLAVIASAEELYGEGSNQAVRAAEAFDAVEIFDSTPNPAPDPFPGSSGSEDSTLFLFVDPGTGLLQLGRRETALGDPAQGSFLAAVPVNAARPAVSGDGTVAAFVDSTNDICLIDTAAPGSEECLGFPGLVYSVAMSPDASLFGFVFLDGLGNPTNQITVIDVETGADTTYQLVAPLVDGASAVEIVQADQMEIAASNRYLFYDALNSIEVDGGTVGVWSIYALDLATGATLVIVPPILGLDIGYPNLAQTSDFHLVFDVLDAVSGGNTVYAGDLMSGALQPIVNTSTWSIPGYTGDDRAIVYSELDAAAATGTSLYRVLLADDRITPASGVEPWLQDADFNAMYRRGSFSGPVSVDLNVSGVLRGTQFDVGDSPTYEVNVKNEGTETATGVELVVRHPSGLELDAGPNGTDASCTLVNQEVVCTGNLEPGQTMRVDASFLARIAGQFPFSANVSGEQTDPDTTNNAVFFDFTVNNDPPTLVQAIPDRSGSVGTAFSFNFSTYFSDPNGEALLFSASGLPAGLQLDAQSGVISGTPSMTGSTDVTVTATDASGASAQDEFSVDITAAAPPPPPGSDSDGGGGGAPDVVLLLLLCQILLVGMYNRWNRNARARNR